MKTILQFTFHRLADDIAAIQNKHFGFKVIFALVNVFLAVLFALFILVGIYYFEYTRIDWTEIKNLLQYGFYHDLWYYAVVGFVLIGYGAYVLYSDELKKEEANPTLRNLVVTLSKSQKQTLLATYLIFGIFYFLFYQNPFNLYNDFYYGYGWIDVFHVSDVKFQFFSYLNSILTTIKRQFPLLFLLLFLIWCREGQLNVQLIKRYGKALLVGIILLFLVDASIHYFHFHVGSYILLINKYFESNVLLYFGSQLFYYSTLIALFTTVITAFAKYPIEVIEPINKFDDSI